MTIITPSTPNEVVDLTEEEVVDVVKVQDGDQERTETLWTDKIDDLLVEETTDDLTEAPRSPRQSQGTIIALKTE